MTTEELTDYSIVKKRYPEAFMRTEKRYAGAMEYTIFDPDSGHYVGPTAFSPDTAWMWAAERLRRGEG